MPNLFDKLPDIDPRLPKPNTATAMGLKTTVQAAVTAFIIFSTGFFNTLHSVPGCSEAVLAYIKDNALQLSLYIGVPAGLFSTAWNWFFNDKVKNY